MDTQSPAHEYLHAIRATLEDHGRRLVAIPTGLASLGHSVGGLTTAVYTSKEGSEAPRRRIKPVQQCARLLDSGH